MAHAIRKFTRIQLLITGVILVLLIAARIALPYYVKKIVNRQLAENMDPYSGYVQDIDIFLLAGRYTIVDLNIVKKGADHDEPFVTIPKADLSVQWKALFHGSIVGEVEVYDPEVNFVFAEDASAEQTGAETDWTQVVKDLMPIEINRFLIVHGNIDLAFIKKDLELRTSVEDLQLEIRNMRNVEDKNNPLPSPITASAYSPTYQGEFDFKADANLLRVVPDMDYDMKFENIELTSVNPMFRYFTDMDFEKGTLDLYSEMIIKDGELEGYLKPVFTDATIFRSKEKGRGLIAGIKEFFAEGAQEILENHKLETSATKIPVAGTLENVKTDFWPTLVGLLRNAYWQAILKKLDYSIDFAEQAPGQKDNKKIAQKREE